MAAADELKTRAQQALARRDFSAAAHSLAALTALNPQDVGVWLNLAGVRRAGGDLAGALEAAEGALAAQPLDFLALLLKASLLERMGQGAAAALAYGAAILQAPPDERLDAPTRAALHHGRELNARHALALESRLKSVVADTLGARRGPDSRRLNAFVEQALGRRRHFPQQPTHFHYPHMPAVEFYDREPFPWLEALEDCTPAIQRELAAALADGEADLQPYIQYADSLPLDQWAELNNSRRWSAYHLMYYGRPVAAHAAACPQTMAALALAPQPQVPGRSPAAMFSVLEPRTRIPAHTGVANTRLVCHLPLVVPPGCGFRVGAETRGWSVGEAFVFDDTIEHEAWNDGDGRRVVLIFDIWRPELSAEERAAIAALMAEMDRFNGDTGEGSL